MGRESNTAVQSDASPQTEPISIDANPHLLTGLESTLSPLATASTAQLNEHERDHALRIASTMAGVLDRTQLEKDVKAFAHSTALADLAPEEMGARMNADFTALWKSYGEHFGTDQWNQVRDLYAATLKTAQGNSPDVAVPIETPRAEKVRPIESSSDTKFTAAETQAQLKADIEATSKRTAGADFNKGPNEAPSASQTEADLKALAAKYKLTNATEVEALVKQYQKAYEKERESLYDNNLAWYEKAYYGVSSWVSSAWDSSFGRVVQGIIAVASIPVDAAKAVIEYAADVVVGVVSTAADIVVGAAELGWAAVTGVASFGWSAISSVASFGWDAICAAPSFAMAALKAPFQIETYQAIGSAIVGTYNFITSIPERTWSIACGIGSAVGNFALGAVDVAGSILSGIGNGIASAAVGIYDFATSASTWKAVGQGLSAAWSGIVSAASTTLEFAVAIATNPVKAYEMLKTGAIAVVDGITAAGPWIWKGLCVASEAIGLTALVSGLGTYIKEGWATLGSAVNSVVHLAGDFARLAKGEITAEQLKQNLKSGISETLSHAGAALKGLGTAALGAVQAASIFLATTPIGMAISAGFVIYELSAAATAFAAGGTAMGCLHLGGALLAALPFKLGSVLKGSEKALAPATERAIELLATKAADQALVNVAKDSVVRLAENSLVAAGKEIGKDALATSMKETLERLGLESLEKLTAEQAEQVLKVTLDHLGVEIGEATAAGVRQELAQLGAQELAELQTNLLKQQALAKAHAFAKAEAVCEDLVYKPTKSAVAEMLQSVKGSSAKELAQELGTSKKVAKEIQALIENGRSDKQIKAMIEEKVYGKLRDPIINGMSPGVDRTLEREMAEIAEKYALSKQALIKGGKDGFVEGAEAGLRKGIKRAVDDAFNEHRARKHLNSGDGANRRVMKDEGRKGEEIGPLTYDPGTVHIEEIAQSGQGHGYKKLDEPAYSAETIDGPRRNSPDSGRTIEDEGLLKMPPKSDVSRNKAA